VKAVLASTCRNELEVVVVDDETDGTLTEFLAAFRVRVVNSGGTGSAARARNCGAAGFDGSVLVFVDADVEVEASAIERLVAPLLTGQADATVGNYSDNTAGLGFAQSYKQLYIHTVYSRRHGYIENQFWTALGAIRRSVFADLGGFCTSFRSALGEDTELGQRLTDAGRRVLCQPEARGRHLKEFTVCSLIRNDLRKGISAVGLELGRGRRVTDNRHSSPRDIAAVALALVLATATLTVTVLIASGFRLATVSALAALLIVLFGGYTAARFDLLSIFGRHGVGFVSRAAPLMFLLDLVRWLALAIGLLRLCVQRSIFGSRPLAQDLGQSLPNAGP